ncbi:hypothetical protein D3C76_214060 [compost metagenome]
MADFKIIITGRGKGQVYRNGELLDGVMAVKVTAQANSLATVELTMAAGFVDLEVKAEPEADD